MPTADGGVRFAQGSYYRAAQHWRRAAAFIVRTSFALLTGRRVQRTIRRIGSAERGTGKTGFLCVYPWRRQFLARSSGSLALNETVTGVPIRRRRDGAIPATPHNAHRQRTSCTGPSRRPKVFYCRPPVPAMAIWSGALTTRDVHSLPFRMHEGECLPVVVTQMMRGAVSSMVGEKRRSGCSHTAPSGDG